MGFWEWLKGIVTESSNKEIHPMTLLRKLSAPLAGIAIVAVILTLVAPRAARAVAAVFVQVTNTVTAPAVTQNVPNLASQIVTLTAQVDASSFTKVFLFYQCCRKAVLRVPLM